MSEVPFQTEINPYGDPSNESLASRKRLLSGSTDIGAEIAAYEVMLRDPEIIHTLFAIGGTHELPDDALQRIQKGIAEALMMLLLGYLGDEGRQSLHEPVSQMKGIVETLPEGTEVAFFREEILSTIESIQKDCGDFRVGYFDPQKLPLSPNNIRKLVRLRILTPERMLQLLPAIRFWIAITGYGLEPEARYNLYEFFEAFRYGYFLQEFLKELADFNEEETKASLMNQVQEKISPQILILLSQIAARLDIDITSTERLYDFLPKAVLEIQRELYYLSPSPRREQLVLLGRAIQCLYLELESFLKEEGSELVPETYDEEYDEDGLPLDLDFRDWDEDDEEEGFRMI